MKIIIIASTVLIFCATALAQKRSRSLTMDDLSPLPKKQETISTADSGPESEWQRKMNEVELSLLTLQLHSALDKQNSALKIKLFEKQAQLDRLRAEGRSRAFHINRSKEVNYRLRYVDLRLEMIKLQDNTKPVPPDRIYIRHGRYIRYRVNSNRNLTKMEQLEQKLADLKEEGRHADIAPGIFRD